MHPHAGRSVFLYFSYNILKVIIYNDDPGICVCLRLTGEKGHREL